MLLFKNTPLLLSMTLLFASMAHAEDETKKSNGSLNVDSICADAAKILCLQASKIVAKAACVKHLKAEEIYSPKAIFDKACIKKIATTDLCLTGTLQTNHFECCQKYKAAATYGANTLYTLGDPLNWDVILDDPNGNTAMGPFSYTVPVTGYYVVTFHMDHHSLSGSGLINGAPVGQLRLFINGNELRSQYTPFLSFSDMQKTSLTTLCLLNAGDVVTMNYNVLMFDIASGFIPYVGTIIVEGNGGFAGESGFAIHYLSSICNGTTPCPEISCTSSHINCHPCEVNCCERDCK